MGTSGIVTMEDIDRGDVGEINDEYDDEERTYVKLNDRTYIFEAKTLLSDFYKIMKLIPLFSRKWKEMRTLWPVCCWK